MSAAATRDLANRYAELLDRHDLDGAVQLCTPGCRFHGFGPEPLDAHGFIGAMMALLAAFPDARFPVDDLVVEDGKAANRHHLVGTHTGAFQGIPPTGKAVKVQGIDVVHIADGQIQEFWLNADFLGLLQQIGAIPQPETATV
jgi:steroid delta-isomerase-like uncharacterized protein